MSMMMLNPDNRNFVLFSKNFCFICSEISFEDSVKQDEFNTLVEYTKKTSFDSEGSSYYDYLTEESYTRNIMWTQPTYVPEVRESYMFKDVNLNGRPNGDVKYSNLAISKTEKYYVFFEKYNPATLNDAREERKDVTVTNPVAVEQYWVAIVPSDDIEDYCHWQGS